MGFMVALAGAFAFIVPYGSQATPDTVISARPEILRIARALDLVHADGHLDRHEIASTLARSIALTESALDDLDSLTVGPAGERSLNVVQAFVENLESLRRLSNTFSGELQELGLEPKEVTGRLNRMASRASSGRFGRILGADAKAVKQARPEIRQLVGAFGIQPLPPAIPSYPVSRWELAVALGAISGYALQSIKSFDIEAPRLAWDGWGPTAAQRTDTVQKHLQTARTLAQNRSKIERLLDTFGYELGVLGYDVPAVRRSLDQIAKRAPHLHAPTPGEAYFPFPDVAQDHWAAKSIQNLRMAGILRGQPNGTFGK
jgi:hypothetical protein